MAHRRDNAMTGFEGFADMSGTFFKRLARAIPGGGGGRSERPRARKDSLGPVAHEGFKRCG
jgi:hypothetical protein